VLSDPGSFRAGPRLRYSRIPSYSYRGPIRPGPKAPTGVAGASTAPTAEVVRNRPGRRCSCRPSHGNCSSSGKGPSPGPTGRPGTSGGDTSVQEEAQLARCPRLAPAWIRPRRRLPAHQCTGEATFWFACWCSCPCSSPPECGRNHSECLGSISNPALNCDLRVAYVAARSRLHFPWSAGAAAGSGRQAVFDGGVTSTGAWSHERKTAAPRHGPKRPDRRGC
jgi:hypothetical protein